MGTKKREKGEKKAVTFMQDQPDVAHAHTMCTESITKQISLQQDGDVQTLTLGRTEVVRTIGSQRVSDTELQILGYEQGRILVSLIPWAL